MSRYHVLMVLALLLCASVCIVAQDAPAEEPKPVVPQPYSGASRQVLRVGFAQAEITPDRTPELVGYGFRAEGNDGVRDPLMARVLVISDGAQPGVIVSLDQCMLGNRRSSALREAVAEAANTAPERVMIAATHTHSGPGASDEYMDAITPRIADAARRACHLMFPAELRAHAAPLGMAYSRRARMPDGAVRHCWGPQEWPDRPPAPAPDPTCTLLMLRQTNGPRQYLLWNFGAHPVVLGKTSRVVSADYPGVACRLIEEYVPNSRAIFALGPCGETQPLIATQEDPAQVETVARVAAAFVALQAQAAQPIGEPNPTLRAAMKTITMGKGEANLTVWRLGGVWFVGLPGEIFQELGLELRRKLDGPVIILTLTNGSIGYVPTREAFAEGGYEVNIAIRNELQPGDGERMIEEVVALAGTLQE